MKRKMMRLLCLVVACSLLTLLLPMQAGASGNTLKVYVAYWGQNHAQPILKETFSRSELASMGTVTVQYTAYDKGNRCRYGDAEGVLLEDVLYSANIDFWDADSLHFYTTDEPGGYDNPYTLGYLFADRYSFPLLSQYYGTEYGFHDPQNPDLSEEEILDFLWTQCESVPVMLALRDNYSRVDGYSVFEGGDLYSDNSFHLLFGQKSPTDQTSSRHAKWIESIVVLYDHYPELTTDETELNLTKDNNGYKVEVSLADQSIDPALLRDVMQSLQWSTSDSSIISLEPGENGVCYLNIHGPGTVTVTVTSDRYYDAGGGRLSLSITIDVGDDEEFGNGDGEGTGEGDGTGSGSGEGEGSGDGEGEGDDGSSGTVDDGETGDQGSEGGTGEEPADPDVPPADDPTTPTEAPDAPTQPPVEESTEPPVEEPTEKPADVTAETESEEPTEDPTEEPTEELYLTPDDGDTEMDPQPIQPDIPKTQTLNVQKLVMNGADAEAQTGQSSGYEGGSQAQVLFEENPLMRFTFILAVLLFILGGTGRYVIYKREV